MTSNHCPRCDRALGPDEGRPIPALLAAAVEIAFAFFHGGMWAQEMLSKPFCTRCARTVTIGAIFVSAVVLTVASFGLALWLHGGGR